LSARALFKPWLSFNRRPFLYYSGITDEYEDALALFGVFTVSVKTHKDLPRTFRQIDG